MDERGLKEIEERLEKAVRQDDQGGAVDLEDAWAFQEHAPADIRALLAEVRRLKAIEDLAQRMRKQNGRLKSIVCRLASRCRDEEAS